MTILVRDEADIMAANLDFHLAQGVDFIIATDNCSEDETADILRSYEARGVLRYLFEPADDYAQGHWVTGMARLAHDEHGADWIINNDADEFWWPQHGNLKSVLQVQPGDVVALRASRYNFPPVEGQGEFHQRMIYRETRSFNEFGLPLPPKVAHRASAAATVAQGNHQVTGIGAGAMADAAIDILHFPVRNLRQLENKIAKGGAAYARNQSLPARTGRTWRKLHGELQRDGSLRPHYDRLHLDAAALQTRIASGDLVIDTRLKQHFAESE